MALKTKIIVQQILNIDDTTTTASKYPKYTVVLGNSISSITAGELTAAVEASAASAAAAKDSEIAAKLSEINARDSENKAAIYADSSEASATQSVASAAEAERQAGLSQKSAEASATSAEESKGFMDSAELAAQNAETSRRLAEQAKTAAQQAQTAAETAKAGAETAKEGADAAATTAGEHAAAAKQYELNAKESEVNAAGSAVEAGDKAVDATTEANRAKAEADRAAQIVDSKLDKEDISGFIKVYKTKAEADADVGSRVLGEKILVWNQTDSKYGWYKVAGTAEIPVLELVETEQKLVSINNVRADDVGNVQITLPGGNPSLWLGEVTWFPYDKDSGVGYPGVLPADGREVLRVDYSDTWEAIEAGLIPSVTEEQWQAGATLYFSTGNGTTTFRLPDMMQGQAFRAAAKGEENAGAIKEQIPYITMVNGIGPSADGSVNIAISADSFEGILPVAKGGTGASTIETARLALGLGEASTEDIIPITKGGTGASTVEETRTALGVPASSDVLKKANNLSDLADRAASWLNVRPDGPTPLAADPVDDKDAATKGWVKTFIASVKSVLASWSVINGDTTAPADNTTVYGGDMWSTYQVAGADYVKLGYRAKVTIGGGSTGELRLVDSRTGGVSKTWEMPAGGGTLLSTSDIGTSGNKIPKLDVQNTWSKTQVFQGGGLVAVRQGYSYSLPDTSGMEFVSRVTDETGKIRLGSKFFCNFDGEALRRAIIQVTTDNDATAQIFAFDQRGDISSAKGIVQWSGSDTRIKTNFEPVQSGSWERISKIGICEYTYKVSPTPQRGYLAQQMMEIDPLYVFEGGRSVDDNGKEFEILNVNDKAVTADLIIVVQQMQEKLAVLEDHNKKIIPLEEEIATLKDEVNTLKKLLVEINQSLAIASRVSTLESEVNELKRS